MPILRNETHHRTIAFGYRRALASHLAGERMISDFSHLRAFVEKGGFNEEQPRVPGGNGRESGRWRYVEGYAQGRQRGMGDNGGPSLDPVAPSETPPKDKASKVRAGKALAKIIARRAGPIGVVLAAIEAGQKLYAEWPSIRSYQDGPKSFSELQQHVGKRRPGYDDHHIVEQNAGAREGFSSAAIDGTDNVVSIPRYKHHEITGWYSRPNPEFGMQSPREYLRGRDWSEHMRIGYRALRDNGVLK
jgi:hypothetical protein